MGVPSGRQSSFFPKISIQVPTRTTVTPATVRPPQPAQVPLTMAYCEDHHTLVTASADMTLLQWYLDDIPSIKHYTIKSRWPTKHAAMSMCWSSSHRLLYSGTTAGTIQGNCVRDTKYFVDWRFLTGDFQDSHEMPNLLDLKLSIKAPRFTGIWRFSGSWRPPAPHRTKFRLSCVHAWSVSKL